jgi:hypothetical protein
VVVKLPHYLFGGFGLLENLDGPLGGHRKTRMVFGRNEDLSAVKAEMYRPFFFNRLSHDFGHR